MDPAIDDFTLRKNFLVIPALERLKHEDGEFEASLGYQARTCLKNTEEKKKTKRKGKLLKTYSLCSFSKIEYINVMYLKFKRFVQYCFASQCNFSH
jgi:hypothetical protein